ncbi:hypothetical protein BO71DRAFT_405954 [Aspergillus ellipticus CBS 707.79]|uniref:Uncharacterized protein n=1 Tax=Aspergillus ellipticus CBS 707.79 TaxID=1448320 RepID=A0A319E4K4_9EURO|nr:hypothetical protein BO71DRAFT_405954 [Aspergillus ellipticus CBS 707.79]
MPAADADEPGVQYKRATENGIVWHSRVALVVFIPPPRRSMEIDDSRRVLYSDYATPRLPVASAAVPPPTLLPSGGDRGREIGLAGMGKLPPKDRRHEEPDSAVACLKPLKVSDLLRF